MVKLALVKAPSTAAMTTNTTQLVIDLATLACGREDPNDLAEIRRRARVTLLCIVGFITGCVAGAILEVRFGIGALALPVILAVLAVALGEEKGRTDEQF